MTSRKPAAAGIAVVLAVLIAWFVYERAARDADPAARGTRPHDEDAAAPVPLHRASPRRADETAKDDATPVSNAALPAPVDLDKVDRDLDLHGVVVDATGNPVAGARIATGTYPGRTAGDHDAWNTERAGPSTRSARDGTFTTGSDGTYELLGWTGEGIEDIHVLAEGYARESKIVAGAERLDFELQRGFAITGRVVDSSARPVADAIVSARAGGGGINGGYAETDGEGRFRVTSLAIGPNYALMVEAPGHARLVRATGAASTPADLDLGDVTLAAPRRLEGTLLDSEGAPVPRAPVKAVGPHAGLAFSCAADDLGRFRFADVPPGWYAITSQRSGEPEARVDVEVASDADLLDVKLVQKPTRDVVVTVVDGAGEPVAGTSITVSESSGARVLQRTTDATGIARLRVPPGAPLQFWVYYPSDGPRKFLLPPQRPLGEDATVRVVLDEAAEVTGRLVDPDGAPVVGAMLWIGPSDARSGFRTGDDGRFRALVPKDRRCVLDFDGQVRRSPGVEDSGLAAHVSDVAPGSDLLVRCERVAKDRQLVVVLVSPQGEPVPGVNIGLTPIAGGMAAGNAKTDQSGRASFRDLPARELRVHVGLTSAELLPPAPANVVPNGQELRLQCRAASRMTGTVVDGSGARLGGGGVVAKRGNEFVGWANVDPEGRFTLLLPAEETNPVRLEVNRTGGRQPDATLDGVVPGAQDVRIVEKK